jgi:hypothetical protein
MRKAVSVSILSALLVAGGATGSAFAKGNGKGYHGKGHAVPVTKVLPRTGFGGTAPAVQAGTQHSVAAISTSPRQLTTLPATGGATPTTPNAGLLALLIGAFLTLLGSGLRLQTVRHR